MEAIAKKKRRKLIAVIYKLNFNPYLVQRLVQVKKRNPVPRSLLYAS